ncbi:MAG: hypothetical protein R3256_10515 [Thalassovita sp.]|nr:hypothetical protein [Thalassovita sp.]
MTRHFGLIYRSAHSAMSVSSFVGKASRTTVFGPARCAAFFEISACFAHLNTGAAVLEEPPHAVTEIQRAGHHHQMDSADRAQCLLGVAANGPHRQSDGEYRSHADFSINLQRARHQHDQVLGDGQSQSGAAETARGRFFSLIEGFEDPLDGALRHSDTIVADRKDDFVTVGTRGYAEHNIALRAIFSPGQLDRVAQQVQQDLPQPDRVAAHHVWQAGVSRHHKFHAAVLSLHGKSFRGAFNRFEQQEVCIFDSQLAGLDFRGIQDVVDDPQKEKGRIPDRVDHPRLLVVQWAARQQFDDADDPVHRRADFMAHIGKEHGFRGIRRLGRALLQQRLGGLFPLGDAPQLHSPIDASGRTRGCRRGATRSE